MEHLAVDASCAALLFHQIQVGEIDEASGMDSIADGDNWPDHRAYSSS
jgi:hypothetical protein